MKPIIAVFATFAYVTDPLAEEAVKSVPRLSGEEFIRHYFDQLELPIFAREQSAIINHQFAEGYLAGVAASSQDKEWCGKRPIKRAAIESEVTAAMRRLPPEKLRDEASSLIVDILRKEFPCQRS